MAQSKIDLENKIRQTMVDSVGGESPEIDAMSKELTNHIVEFIQAQTFTITSLNATQVANTTTPSVPGAPGAPHIIPKTTVTIDEDNTASDNPFSGVESIQSKVQLKILA
mgnify:CR=1 FL=1